jgi:hypothetical protein
LSLFAIYSYSVTTENGYPEIELPPPDERDNWQSWAQVARGFPSCEVVEWNLAFSSDPNRAIKFNFAP